MSRATIQVDDAEVLEALNALVQRSQSLKQPFDEIAGMMVASTRRRFQAKQAPDGTPWVRNTDTTINTPKPKDKDGYGGWVKGRNDPLIGESGDLSTEIHAAATADTLTWGSRMVYAAMQHFGGTQAEFSRLWGDIPARPFLGVDDDDREAIIETLRDWLNGPI